MDTLVSGTQEYLVVKVDDRREEITDLTPLVPTFDVLDKLDAVKQSAVAVDCDGLKAYCLIDTRTGYGVGSTDPWPSGIYRLYIRFTSLPERPLHGPFPFRVEVR